MHGSSTFPGLIRRRANREPNAVVRFAGGDEAAADTGAGDCQEPERIRRCSAITQCQDCDAQIRDMLQEQLQEMERVQTRLQSAEKEKQDKGIFGWLWK
jgi:hypothetical protein